MLFTPKDFEKFVAPSQAILIAKICNSLLDTEGTVVYGTASARGELVDFSTTKKKSDTHVAILLGVSEMGNLRPIDGGFTLTPPDAREIAQALEAKLNYLEKENEK